MAGRSASWPGTFDDLMVVFGRGLAATPQQKKEVPFYGAPLYVLGVLAQVSIRKLLRVCNYL